MSREIRLYIVNKVESGLEQPEKGYAEVLAMYDMRNFCELDSIFRRETDSFIYADGSETKVFTDGYDEALREASIDEVIEFFDNYMDEGSYRRIPPLYAMLKMFSENASEWGDLAVLCYGY